MNRHLIIPSWISLSILLFTAVCEAKAPARAHATLPKLLGEVEAKYAKAVTVTADFTETDETAALGQKKTSSGTLEFKRGAGGKAAMLRWETLKPDRNLLVSDGKTFWYYTPPFDQGEPGQYWERPASQVQSRFAQELLAGSFTRSLASHAMTLRQASAGNFVLRPKKGTSGDVEQATLHIDTKRQLITGISLAHRGGNKSEITLSGITLGKPLSDSLFRFIPPPNTEKLQDD